MLQSKVTRITRKKGLTHYGSSLGVLKVLEEVDPDPDTVVLDEAHGALGYYVWLESKGLGKAEEMIDRHGVHQNKDDIIKVSGGSLGLAGTVGLGMALTGREINCITSDGALAEGIWWEILRIKADRKLDNFKIYVHANGWGGYDPISLSQLQWRVGAFCPDVVFIPRKAKLEDHYKKI